MSVREEVRASSWGQNKALLSVYGPLEFCLTHLQTTFLQATSALVEEQRPGKAHCSDTSLAELCWKGFLLIFGPFLIFIVSKRSFSRTLG